MRFATWNVNGLRARLDFVVHWLSAREPDVVALQELKLTEEQFPFDAFEALGYAAAVHGQKSWNGVALLSKKPIESVSRGLPGQEDFGARLVSARIDGISFTSVYCPNGKSLDHDDFPRKLAWYEALVRHWWGEHGPDEPAVLGGDFNICPAAIDGWRGAAADGSLFHTADERRLYASLLEPGLVDVFREKKPDSGEFSWWDYRGGAFHRKQGLRIDHLLATRSVLERVAAVEIDRDYRKKQDGLTPSDHAPVFADLDRA